MFKPGHAMRILLSAVGDFYQEGLELGAFRPSLHGAASDADWLIRE